MTQQSAWDAGYATDEVYKSVFAGEGYEFIKPDETVILREGDEYWLMGGWELTSRDRDHGKKVVSTFRPCRRKVVAPPPPTKFKCGHGIDPARKDCIVCTVLYGKRVEV